MSKLEFDIILTANTNILTDLIYDFEKFPKYLPDQLGNVRIIEQKDNVTITEDTLFFSSILKLKSYKNLNTLKNLRI